MRGKKVLLSVTGIAHDIGSQEEADEMRLVTTGELSGDTLQGPWQLRYTETQPDAASADRITFTMDKGTVTMLREGEYSTSMIFSPGSRYEGSYDTPWGALEMGVFPTQVKYRADEDKGEVVLKYQLDIQGHYSSMREMRIRFARSHRS